MALVRRPSRSQVAGLAVRGNNGNNGNGQVGGDVLEVDALLREGNGDDGTHLSALAMAMKSGNINQGYDQCYVDQLAIAVMEGRCSAERIQCRQMATLRALDLDGGDSVNFTIRPSGPAFVREILLVFSEPNTPGEDFVPILEQMNAKGRFGITGRVTSTLPTGNVASGLPLTAFTPDFQNYVAPSGIVFDAATVLDVTVRNDGANIGGFILAVTYDEVRAG